MTLDDYYFRTVPEYYPTMYLDGFTPEQIMYAHRRKMRRRYEQWCKEQQEKTEDINLKITSEVKIK